MAGGITKILCFVVFISLAISKGSSHEDQRCPPETIKIVQTPTGKKMEWKVDVTNTCNCNPYQVQLSCPKFETVVVNKDDQSIISEIDNNGHCLLNKGQPLSVFEENTVSFTYVGNRIEFSLYSYFASCS
ncbi:hypothetical protein ACP275_02G064400 [Erythranthe tilingii]